MDNGPPLPAFASASVRALAYHAKSKLKQGAMVAFLVLLLAGIGFVSRDAYKAAGVVTFGGFGYFDKSGLPSFTVIENVNDGERKVQWMISQDRALRNACVASARSVNDAQLIITCTGETSDQAEGRMRTVANSVLERHRGIAQMENVYAEITQKNLVEQLASIESRLKKLTVLDADTPRKGDNAGLWLLLQERRESLEQVRIELLHDIEKEGLRRRLNRASLLQVNDSAIVYRAPGAVILALLVAAALVLGAFVSLSLALLDTLRHRITQ